MYAITNYKRPVNDSCNSYREFFGREPSLLICDADMIKQIMVKEFHNFPDRGNNNRVSIELFLSLIFLKKLI